MEIVEKIFYRVSKRNFNSIIISIFSSTGSNGRPNRKQSNNQQSRPKFRNKIIDDIESNESLPQARALGKNRPTTARPSYK